MPNHLHNQSSAYLRKHANNPVEWYPWGKQAFSRARREDKPLFISIGYFSCHWCSVMERESFEDEETAAFMNDHFINIKVDREDQPDVDKIYQRYYTTLTGEGGGWPLNVYAFPDGLPFYIITYLPKNFSLRSRTFMSLNREIVASWTHERDELFEISLGLSRNLDASNRMMTKNKDQINDQAIVDQLTTIQDKMDWINGGILDGQTKFPRFSLLRFLLKESILRDADKLLQFVNLTYDRMSRGGIYDQLGGGIMRYSVDKNWRVPHFEKMLYDQAGWLRFSSELYKATKNDYILSGLNDMVRFIQQELTSPAGGFYSSIDAESDGIEGRYYAFTHDEIKHVLDTSYFGWHINLRFFRVGIGKPDFLLNEDYKIAKLRYKISKIGNFTDPYGKIVAGNVLNVKMSISEISKHLDLKPKYVAERLGIINEKLYHYQQSLPKPRRDTKIISAWNAMMITALFELYEASQLEQALDLAVSALEFITTTHLAKDVLIRSSNEDSIPENAIPGILDDYVFLIEALIKGFEVTDNFQHLMVAEQLQLYLDMKFYHENEGIYYLNEKDEDVEIGRILSAMDDSFQSALSVEILNLFKLGHYLEKEELTERGQEILLILAEPAKEYKGVMSEYFISAGYYLRYPDEIVIIEDKERKFDTAIQQKYWAEKLVYRWPRTDNAPKWEVLQEREKRDIPTVFICKGATCSLPITSELEIKEYT